MPSIAQSTAKKKQKKKNGDHLTKKQKKDHLFLLLPSSAALLCHAVIFMLPSPCLLRHIPPLSARSDQAEHTHWSDVVERPTTGNRPSCHLTA